MADTYAEPMAKRVCQFHDQDEADRAKRLLVNFLCTHTVETDGLKGLHLFLDTLRKESRKDVNVWLINSVSQPASIVPPGSYAALLVDLMETCQVERFAGVESKMAFLAYLVEDQLKVAESATLVNNT